MKRLLKLSGLAIILLASHVTSARAGLLVKYDFDNSSDALAASWTASGLSAGNIEGSANLDVFSIFQESISNPGVQYTSQVLRINTADGSAKISGAVAQNSYFEFELKADQGSSLNLTSLEFDAARGGSSGTRGWFLRSSLDSFENNLGSSNVASVRPTLTNYSVGLGAGFSGLNSVTFRIYSYAPNGERSLEYDNIQVMGAVVPEPSTLVSGLLAGLICVGYGVRRRHTRADA